MSAAQPLGRVPPEAVAIVTLLIIALDVFVIWALAVYGGRLTTT